MINPQNKPIWLYHINHLLNIQIANIIVMYLMVRNIVWHVYIQKTFSRVTWMLCFNQHSTYDRYAYLSSKGEVMQVTLSFNPGYKVTSKWSNRSMKLKLLPQQDINERMLEQLKTPMSHITRDAHSVISHNSQLYKLTKWF